ncbi:serine O-acetyltransferase [Planctobacterium marinum]|uniref:serine O-acetyltransferase n=1 Tax=Planctobacterium marinum TaxID=1631968 RepID=UPI00226CD522|nr:hypothetical protein [Planctobacterium marinum]
MDIDFWTQVTNDARKLIDTEAFLCTSVYSCVLSQHSFEAALSFILAKKNSKQSPGSHAIKRNFSTKLCHSSVDS